MATITLPNLNVALEAGLAVGTDAGFTYDLKLPVHISSGLNAACSAAAIWAYERFSDESDVVRALYVNGAVACIKCGLCVRVGTSVDGDWEPKEGGNIPVPSDAVKNGAQAVLPPAIMRDAVILIVATKANFWAMNHHTGQGEAQGYAKKVLVKLFRDGVNKSAETMAHTIGHWASTIKVLTLAGVRGLKAHGDPLSIAVY